MERYLCELINGNVVEERFFRNGNSVEEVREQIEMYQWPEGSWHIRPAVDGLELNDFDD